MLPSITKAAAVSHLGNHVLENKTGSVSILVTCDEKWIFYDNVIRKSQWCRPVEAPKPTPKKILHSKKLMICVWWDMEGIYTSSYDPTKP
jgi:hypothetical protein